MTMEYIIQGLDLLVSDYKFTRGVNITGTACSESNSLT